MKITIQYLSSRSTKGVGQTQPVKWQDAGEVLSNSALKGCHMPIGPGQVVSAAGAWLQYNEVSYHGYLLIPLSLISSGRLIQYIAYNTSQIRVRYLLMVEMR